MENPFEIINNRLEAIECLLFEILNKIPKSEEEQDILDIHGAANFTGRAEQTIYGLVCRRQIPHSKDGKFLKFSKSKLHEWMMQNERKTHAELAEEAKSFLQSKNKY